MIELRNVSCPAGKPILKNVNLLLRRGEITGIIGRAGSGKSMLLRLLSLAGGSGGKASGEIRFKNRDEELVLKKEALRLITLHDGAAPENMDQRLYDFLLLSRLPYKPLFRPFHEHDLNIVDRYIDFFRLREYTDSPLGYLSESRLHSALLAFSFIRESDLLLIDNPTALLDPAAVKLLYRELTRYVMNGDRAIVLASQDITFIAQTADRVIVLDDGMVAADGGVGIIDGELMKKHFSTDVSVSKNIYNGRPMIHIFSDN
jgi:ABC-type cobalamin/Fe3+-siderophores transport system ATPase subunit